jgi:hypothetical protein
MARTRTTKAVAQRIDLNYFKRATPFKRAKLWLAILAPAAAAVWIGWHVWGRDNRVYSSGRLSAAHAVLETQCAACHVREAGEFSAAAKDSACLSCHDGPAHHPDATTSGTAKLTCEECHIEHRGRMKLAAASSRGCAKCHSDLGVAGPGSQFAKQIRSFADGHPEFALLQAQSGKAPSDPATIKLNHALHMKSIRRGPNGPMVQLECSDCHRPSSSMDLHWEYGDQNYAGAMVAYTRAQQFESGGSRGLPAKRPWSDRQLMAPVKFANACAGCHSLTFDKRFDEGVPHDDPEVVHAYLVRKFAAYIATHPAELREVQEPKRNLAGRETGPVMRAVSADEWVREHVAVSEELLWHKTCAQCHAISATSLQDVKTARWDAAGGQSGPVTPLNAKTTGAEIKLPTIAAARVKLQWLPHARFDHDAHTGFSCAGCHGNALRSTDSADVLIPAIAVCQTCHADGPGHASPQCAECHTYHDWSKRKEVKPAFTLPALETSGK